MVSFFRSSSTLIFLRVASRISVMFVGGAGFALMPMAVIVPLWSAW